MRPDRKARPVGSVDLHGCQGSAAPGRARASPTTTAGASCSLASRTCTVRPAPAGGRVSPEASTSTVTRTPQSYDTSGPGEWGGSPDRQAGISPAGFPTSPPRPTKLEFDLGHLPQPAHLRTQGETRALASQLRAPAGQIEMAEAVAAALEEKKHLLVGPAPAPARPLPIWSRPSCRASASSSPPAQESPGTALLQGRALPGRSLRPPLSVCYMKGRANYLCRQETRRRRTGADSQRPGRGGRLPGDPQVGRDHGNRRPRRDPHPARGSTAWAKLDARRDLCSARSAPASRIASSRACTSAPSTATSSSSTTTSFSPTWR